MRHVTAEITDDEITGVISMEFFDEDRTQAYRLSEDDLDDLSVLSIAIKTRIKRIGAAARDILRSAIDG